jgi:hypothetical protein
MRPAPLSARCQEVCPRMAGSCHAAPRRPRRRSRSARSSRSPVVTGNRGTDALLDNSALSNPPRLDVGTTTRTLGVRPLFGRTDELGSGCGSPRRGQSACRGEPTDLDVADRDPSVRVLSRFGDPTLRERAEPCCHGWLLQIRWESARLGTWSAPHRRRRVGAFMDRGVDLAASNLLGWSMRL